MSSFFPLSIPRFGSAGHLQRSSAQALSEITAKVLRTINIMEKAVCESLHGETQCNGGCALPVGQLPSLGDRKEVAEAYRELEENVRFTGAFCKQGGHQGMGIWRKPPNITH